MPHQTHRFVLIGGNNVRVGCPDALSHLQQRFSSWGSDMERITLPGGQMWGITLLNLRVGEPLPAPKGHLPQTRFGLYTQSMRCGNRLGRLPGALQITRIEDVDGLARQPLRQARCLPLAWRAQGHISLALKASLGSPPRGGVAH